jgi:hypothetical protein
LIGAQLLAPLTCGPKQNACVPVLLRTSFSLRGAAVPPNTEKATKFDMGLKVVRDISKSL